MLEKLHVWSDIEKVGLAATFGRDRLPDDGVVCWVTHPARSAARL
jgi:hypothetical protein